VVDRHDHDHDGLGLLGGPSPQLWPTLWQPQIKQGELAEYLYHWSCS
jgi:hypothetical protein